MTTLPQLTATRLPRADPVRLCTPLLACVGWAPTSESRRPRVRVLTGDGFGRIGQSARAALLSICAFGGSAALAQTDSALPIDSAAANQNTRQRPLWELGVGVAGLRLPDYRGSEQNHSYLLPVPYVVYRGAFLRADREGARAILVDAQRLKVDLSVAGSVPTRSNGNTARRGMPNLPGTFEIGPNLNYTLFGSVQDKVKLDLRLPVRAAISAQRSPQLVGVTFSPDLNLDLGRMTGGWNVGLLGGPLYANRKYNAHYYGVDAPYANSDRPVYRAAGGYAGWQALAATSRRFENIWVGAFVRYDNLKGAVFEASPLVRQRSALTVGFGISYVFARSSDMVAATD